MANLAIVLVEPKYAENIGAAARSAMNMGISQLLVVKDTLPDREKMLKMATHNAAQLIENLALYPTLKEAVAPFAWVVGTTARIGRQRRTISSPRVVASELAPFLEHNRVALVFGREDRGLTNDELKFCNVLSTIPTVDFSSLNLAQAIGIHCYEAYTAVLEVCGRAGGSFAPKQAESHEMEAMYGHVEEMLKTIGFLRQEDHDYWMRTIRQFLGRVGLRSKEARIIRGFCRQFLWYAGQSDEDLETDKRAQ